MKTTVLCVAASLFCFVSVAAGAQCAKDIDCSGELVCIAGTCQMPPPPPGPPAEAEDKAPSADAPPPVPTIQPTVSKPCANVPCSNHGTCVLKNQEPVCSCDDGYQPDSATGLSCIPLKPQQPTTGTGAIDPNDPQLLAVESAVGRKRYSFFVRYHRSAVINAQMSYAEYEIKLARSRRNSGIATLFCSTILTGFGLGMYFVFVDMVGLIPVGATMLALSLAASTTMIIVGAAKWGRYAAWMRRLRPLAQKQSRRLKYEGISPILAHNKSPSGVALTFSF